MVSRSAQRHPRLTLIPLITRLSMLFRSEVFALDRHPQLWEVMLEVAIPRECPRHHPKPAEVLREAVTQHLPLGESFCFFTLNVLLYSQLESSLIFQWDSNLNVSSEPAHRPATI